MNADAPDLSAVRALLDLRRYAAARDAAYAGLRDSPTDPGLSWCVARALLGLGHPATALEVLSRAVADNPQVAGLHDLISRIHLDCGRAAQAVAAAEEAVRLDPPSAPALGQLARSVAASGRDAARARALADRALQLDPLAAARHLDHAAAHRLLATSSGRPGRADLAIAFDSATRALAMAPDSVDALHELARIHRASGRLPEAVAFHLRALRGHAGQGEVGEFDGLLSAVGGAMAVGLGVLVIVAVAPALGVGGPRPDLSRGWVLWLLGAPVLVASAAVGWRLWRALAPDPSGHLRAWISRGRSRRAAVASFVWLWLAVLVAPVLPGSWRAQAVLVAAAPVAAGWIVARVFAGRNGSRRRARATSR